MSELTTNESASLKTKEVENVGVKPITADEQKTIVTEEVQTKDELIKALKSDFATSVTKIYVNSLDKEIGFREITVLEQKNLSRIMMSNENRKDIVYDAQCALINNACLAEGFDIYNLTEYDRLKILMALYQANMFSNELKYTCPECGTENRYHVNFDNVLMKLDKIDLSAKEFSYSSKGIDYKFDLIYPSVQLVSRFHKSYCDKHRSVPKREQKNVDNMQNMEYVNLFINKVSLNNHNNNTIRNIDFRKYKVGDLEEIISMFPQDVLYTDTGVLRYIVENYIKKINDTFDKHTCFNCGTVHDRGVVNSPESFF